MAQDPLFDPPPDRLPRRLHDQVFGELPTLLARSLDVPEVAAAVRPLLEAGWRPAQLGARVGALPAAAEPVAAVVGLLAGLAGQDSPQLAWQRDRAARAGRAQAAAVDGARRVASEQARAHWIAEARRSLGLAAPPRPVAPVRSTPRCACCSSQASFFVTRQVRLCADCVSLLGSGRARLAVGA